MIKRGNELVNKIAKVPLWGKRLIIFASFLCVGMGTTQAFAAIRDTIHTYNNNFTMMSAGGASITGGMNDVVFIWDGTQRHSVAKANQVPNVSFASPTTFFGFTWSTHDCVLYGPGTYTVYTACPGGSPGCGMVDSSHPPQTFTVGPDELGVHYQFNWNVSNDIDMVTVFKRHAAFGPSTMCTNNPDPTFCSNQISCDPDKQPAGHPCLSPDIPRDHVWDLMSYDFEGDGTNGLPFVDGPFIGFSGNMNVMLPGGLVPPHLWPDTDFIKFGGSSGDRVLTIKNNGDTDLNITTVNEPAQPFSIVPGTDTCSGKTLGTSVGSATPPSCTVTIHFEKPETGSDWTTSLLINSNDAGIPGSQTPLITLNAGNDPPNKPVLVSPGNGLSDVGTEQEFRWNVASDINGDPVSYHVYVCTDFTSSDCSPATVVASRINDKGVFYAGGAGLFMIGMTFIGGLTGRKRIVLLLVIVVLFSGGALISCHSKDVSGTARSASAGEVSYIKTGLNAGTTYHWKVVADDGKSTNNTTTSDVWSFTTK